MALNLFAIPPHVSFLDAVAEDWLAQGGDPLTNSQGLILLPTRRAARALGEAFLRASDGRALLLPRIAAFGALDEAPLSLAGALSLPPAVEPMQRLAALTTMILAARNSPGAPRTADRAWMLAIELADLMDQAEWAEIDLRERLPEATDPAYAAHWADTLRFLHIVTDAWPRWLADNGLMNPVARQVALLDAQAAAWEQAAPDFPVLVAGTAAGLPALTRLLRVAARLPKGRVVLPGLDLGMHQEAWTDLDDSHCQAGLCGLLTGLGATRDDVRAWRRTPRSAIPAGRFEVLSHALLPASALQRWREESPADLTGMWRLSPSDQQEEAEAIALLLREALETPGATAALVTPDRDLAQRVTAALLRYGVVADDSAGEKLADTPPSVFMRLLARAVADDLAPVPLLALLKHPLAGAGLSPAACRAAARALELDCLRGPRPPKGLAGLRQRLDKPGVKPASLDLLRRLETCLEPALRTRSAVRIAPVHALAGLVEAAERLAATNEVSGPARLWAGEEGDALAARLSAVQEAIGILPDQSQSVLPGLLDAALEGAVVRARRALRGRDGAEHPRVFIWGLLEARLLCADRLVLGGLAESVWPPQVDPGPWLSRPMRKTVGLRSPEEAVGQAAHDFVAAACSARDVVLSCPTRRDGAPAVPARWLVRLDMYLSGRGKALPEHPAVAWVRALDQPPEGPRPVAPPRPNPPVALRPRKLSVTEIETWLRDPYAIYARHVLGLRPLDPLDQETDAADYGVLVHAGLHRFLRDCAGVWPSDALQRLCRAMDQELTLAGLRPALAAWWAPRLTRIAGWVAQTEARRRDADRIEMIAAEVSGALKLQRPGGDFLLTGRADRLERWRDGGIAILDYKTGAPPTQADVDKGLAPQLLLEAVMAAEGAFGEAMTGKAVELAYWHLTGGFESGAARSLFRGNVADIAQATAAARDSLCRLIDAFDAGRPYISHPHPDMAPRFSDYAQLARVAEWSAAGEEA